jgi:hypothetical protein
MWMRGGCIYAYLMKSLRVDVKSGNRLSQRLIVVMFDFMSITFCRPIRERISIF